MLWIFRVSNRITSTGFFFFQAKDCIRDIGVTGVQTCALPIFPSARGQPPSGPAPRNVDRNEPTTAERLRKLEEMNQALLQQFQGLAQQNALLSKQNAALAGQVQDLSKRL